MALRRSAPPDPGCPGAPDGHVCEIEVKPRPKRPPIRLGEIKTGPIVKRLRELHELGGDPAYERLSASQELFRVLEHAQTWAGQLKQPKDSPVNVMGEAAVLRATLWQHLWEQADTGQLKAIEDGRAAGVPWGTSPKRCA
ncbi:hypothetical protein [Streptomyces doebereineriae]|uniref:Uncharacterized protein n=1 Tax=Streptomyces doebereineriae TaxID=3075528 RepID=A0ABU2VST9_9ACTN|nr:hypothetical protein [Streptomyces sp. DSM 41640]MDT0488206.1 hypothetical protein [Streptomyces sp. DSM 41640]